MKNPDWIMMKGKRIEQINFIIIRICGFNFLTFIQRKMNNSSVDGPNKSQYLNSILKYSVWNWKKKGKFKGFMWFLNKSKHKIYMPNICSRLNSFRVFKMEKIFSLTFSLSIFSPLLWLFLNQKNGKVHMIDCLLWT